MSPAAGATVEALVIAARDGDRGAMAALHGRFAPLVHGILLAKLPPGEADDLMQDVFVRVLQKLPGLRDVGAFPAWLAALSRNFAAGFFRGRRGGMADVGSSEPADPAPGVHTRLEAMEVLTAIRELPEAYSETLMLRLVEGLSGPQIAERTGLTHGSVRVNLCRGMAMLRERLGTAGEA